MDIQIDERVKLNATDKQRKILEVYEKNNNTVAAATELGVSHQYVSKTVRTLLRRSGKSKKVEPYSSHDLKICVIPDLQIKPNVDLRYVQCIGRYIAAKKPDIIVNLGDMADMESLSSYDKFKRSFEGRRYKGDIESVILGQQLLWQAVDEMNARVSEKKAYKPRRVLLLGNHEDRGDRVVEVDPMLFGTIDIRKDLKLADYWDEVYPFKKVVVIENIAFCHYFPTGNKGMACSTASAQLKKMHMSTIAGHQQGRQTYSETSADGRRITSIIAGSSYDYYMDYMGPQGNNHWRGVIMLHNVKNGEFDEVYVPTEYLKNRYGKGLDPLEYKNKD